MIKYNQGDEKHMKFNYSSLGELIRDMENSGLNIPSSENLDVLRNPLKVGDKLIPNALVVHPMEGCDGTDDGKPSELTLRRYERFAKGGAGLLWVEATAVVNEGRANPRQLYLCEENLEDFKAMVSCMLESAKSEYGASFRPYTVVQLTHSGRYSKPEGKAEPIIAVNNHYLDKFLPEEYHIITDEELEALEEQYVKASILAKEAGFDAVDIKSCHRYLNSELLSSFTREGKYGGSFENRTRFLLNIIDKIKEKLGDSIDITLRMNAYDAIPYPFGFGVSENDVHKPNLEEPIRLVRLLSERGIKLINISCGNPYYNPHVGRPFDMGPYMPVQSQLSSISLMLNVIREIQQAVPEINVVATGFSWLREYGANVAAGGVQEGWFRLCGFGRQAFAYPDFARDILEKGNMDRIKCCIACGKCSEIMRDGGKAGCVIKDSEVYAPIYKSGREGKPSLVNKLEAEHI
jgi:2,4-dienoyl-CoA reductase-like NADH-dependent reductase (Old Yellow Enzyme family)